MERHVELCRMPASRRYESWEQRIALYTETSTGDTLSLLSGEMVQLEARGLRQTEAKKTSARNPRKSESVQTDTGAVVEP